MKSKLQWKTWWDRYRVSNKGSVYDLRTKRMLKPKENSKGYWYYNLRTATGIMVHMYAHRLVFIVFIGKISEGKEIDHIDNNRKNNHIDNLQAISHSLNVSKSYDTRKEKTSS